MSEVERIFDRFIDAFAGDLLEIAREYIDIEVGRAVAVAERQNAVAERQNAVAERQSAKAGKAELKAERRRKREEKRLARQAAKVQSKVKARTLREQKRAERQAEKQRLQAERLAEKEQRQVEHDRLKQERVALKQELEAERRRLREATRKRPARQLPLDFDGLNVPKSRRGAAAAANAPPQLFVHKRKRDGQIEKLARNDGPGGGAPDGTLEHAVTNGLAATPPTEASVGAE